MSTVTESSMSDVEVDETSNISYTSSTTQMPNEEETRKVQQHRNCFAGLVIVIVQWASGIWTRKESNASNTPKSSTSSGTGSSEPSRNGSRSTPGLNHDDSFCEPDNIHKQVLENYLAKIKATSKQINSYRGPHFTHEYRSLEEECNRHVSRLEALHVPGMEDFDIARKNALHQVKVMSKKLKGKAHSDGRPCPECELQTIRLVLKSFTEF